MTFTQVEPKKIYIRVDQAAPADALYFEAEAANSTIKLNNTGGTFSVNLETSTDYTTWSDYTFGTDITLSTIWDKVFFRNKSETVTGFSANSSNYYQFVMTGSIAAHWDINYLICKNNTDTLAENYCFTKLFYNATSLTTPPILSATTLKQYCYHSMFYGCTGLTTTPSLPATTLINECYDSMFSWCTNLVTLPSLPALTLASYCYRQMFFNCSKIKVSTTQTWEYQTPYRIPTTWTWTEWTSSLTSMFSWTGWAFTWNPSINTTYYTSNTIV